MKTIVMVALVATVWAPAALSAPPPLSQELQETLDAIRTDPRPRALVKDTHYVISNEPKQWLFREVLETPGAIYLGVGAEQNYLFIGWSRPEVAILMDFDELIPRLHDVYAAIFRRADNPEAFLASWTRANQEVVKGWIEEDYEPPRSDGAQRAWKFSRRRVERHLAKLVNRYTERGMPIFLTDLEQYTYVRGLVRSGRVRAVRGDVTKKSTMADIAAFARKACMPIRTLYLSNVEGYISFYNQNYRRNILGLPGDEHSVVLHTDPSGKNTYRYMVTPLSIYREWIQCQCIYRITVVRRHYVPHGDDGLSTIEKRPLDVPKMVKKTKRQGPGPAMGLPEICPK
jgi:hypothetical protein